MYIYIYIYNVPNQSSFRYVKFLYNFEEALSLIEREESWGGEVFVWGDEVGGLRVRI